MANNEKNRIITTIYGQEYTIVGSEPTDHLKKSGSNCGWQNA
ncbi:hypothetical protein MAQA_08702 [Listeria aquatica FSL S10-1188]|uniref:Uncharacterized protein n=1 Tax=Listeria aquatica FSL S10-1188 TaxID=1265818 RepID=W7B715_9LIST|nr:hypothetical protein MAQA_08702 [Listeria aquatica FSL S10-1188]